MGRFKETLKATPGLYRAARSVHRTINHVLPPRRVAAISGRVHRNDLMWEGSDPASITAYRDMGRAAVGFLRRSLEAAGTDPAAVGSVLDFGCGHGRVLRALVQELPGARATACDLDAEAVRFCAREFGAVPLLSDVDPAKVPLGCYDVIWMGSVLTHLDRGAGCRLLGHLASHLGGTGLVAFSTHSESAGAHPERFGRGPAAARHSLQADLQRGGFAYLAYAHYGHDGYGLAWHTEAFVRQMLAGAGLQVVLYEPEGWLGTQDLWSARIRPGC